MTLTLNAPIRTQVRTIDGVSIRFAESDKRGGADALLTSPWPESLYAFEPDAEFLHERLPLSRLAVLDTGHWAWEDAADEYAALVTAWWDGGYAAVERRSS